MKLLNYSQKLTEQPLKFRNGQVILSHTLPGMWLLIHVEILPDWGHAPISILHYQYHGFDDIATQGPGISRYRINLVSPEYSGSLHDKGC